MGDADQLPSVGAGVVLSDIIESAEAAVVPLTEIFRQAENSLIIENAHRISRSEMPRCNRSATGAFLFPAGDAEHAADLVADEVQNRIPRRFGLDALDDIQVLSPMHRGAGEFNRRLQAALNPPSLGQPEERRVAHLFRLVDRVMRTRNNYDRCL